MGRYLGNGRGEVTLVLIVGLRPNGCDPFSRVRSDVQLGLSPIDRERQEEAGWQPFVRESLRLTESQRLYPLDENPLDKRKVINYIWFESLRFIIHRVISL